MFWRLPASCVSVLSLFVCLAVAPKPVNWQIELRPDHFFLTFPLTFTGKTMADAANKYAENVAGKFYVDDQCIDCDLCRETAPANFKRNDDGGHSYVYKQPESPEEEALCKEAMEGCPVEAIGNDGA
jgi:ferredoxin